MIIVGGYMIRIAICDDTEEYLEILEYKINQCFKKVFEKECKIFKFDNLSSLKDYADKHPVDIIFLDIMVNEINSMDWSIKNFQNRRIQLIFMTAYPQAAYNISESNCCYFLVKSKINEETLKNALFRAIKAIGRKNPNLTTVKLGTKSITIDYNDIVYLETFNNNLTLHLKDKDDITIYNSLKEYSKQLPLNFLRCHKCYMVNMNFIASFEPHKFTLKNGQSVPIPPKKYKSIIKTYTNYLISL